MNVIGRTTWAGFALATGLTAAVAAPAPYAHVLLLSIDGMHALDLANQVAARPSGTLAALTRTGVVYPDARTPIISDSFPGLVAQVTGGGPRTTGIYYDDSYDRTLFAPGSDCKGPPGTEVAFASDIDIDPTRQDAGGTIGKPMMQIDPKKLPLRKTADGCTPVYPHDYLRVNTLFEVVHAHGGRTAWSDKHPAYEWLGGPSGQGLDDLYAVEQDAFIPGTKVRTTGSFKAEREFDEMRVKALLNEMKGLDGAGAVKVGVPVMLGMNFQAVSVGQKLPEAGPGDAAGLKGGYADASGRPNTGLKAQFDYLDAALGELMAGLKDNGLADSTLVIVSAKHGQSPIDPTTFQPIDDKLYEKIPGYAFHVADDGALVWLRPEKRAEQLPAALDYIGHNLKPLGIGQVFTPEALIVMFADPARDGRVPDILLGTNPGVVYTSGKKIAEHGGLNFNDRNVLMLVSNPTLKPSSEIGAVATTQTAPTILKALGYAPEELQAVLAEHTPGLPGLPF